MSPPHPPDALLLFHDDARRHRRLLGEHIYRLERHMNYTQGNLLWGTLALSRPTQLPDGSGALYSIDLPKPVHLSPYHGFPPALADGAPLLPGHYVGRVSLHLDDARFAPVFTHTNQWLSVERRPPPQNPSDPSGPCIATLYLHNLRRIQIPNDTQSDSDSSRFLTYSDYFQSEMAAAYQILCDIKHGLTSLLHPDEPRPLRP